MKLFNEHSHGMVSNAKILAEIQMKKSKAIGKLQEFEIPGFLLPAIVHLENQDDESVIRSMEKELIAILVYNLDKQFIRFELTFNENLSETKVYAGTSCEIKEQSSGRFDPINFLEMEFSLCKEIAVQSELALDQAELDVSSIFNPLFKNALKQTKRLAHAQNNYLQLADLVNYILMLRLLEILHLAMERIVNDSTITFFNLKTPFYLIANIKNGNTFLIYSILLMDE